MIHRASQCSTALELVLQDEHKSCLFGASGDFDMELVARWPVDGGNKW